MGSILNTNISNTKYIFVFKHYFLTYFVLYWKNFSKVFYPSPKIVVLVRDGLFLDFVGAHLGGVEQYFPIWLAEKGSVISVVCYKRQGNKDARHEAQKIVFKSTVPIREVDVNKRTVTTAARYRG